MKMMVPIRTHLGLNARLHPFARYRIGLQEKNAVRVYWALERNAARCAVRKMPAWRITLTRISPASKKADDDNVVGGLKIIRDELARLIGIDDGSPRVQWMYQQVRGQWGVMIEIEEAPAPSAQPRDEQSENA